MRGDELDPQFVQRPAELTPGLRPGQLLRHRRLGESTYEELASWASNI